SQDRDGLRALRQAENGRRRMTPAQSSRQRRPRVHGRTIAKRSDPNTQLDFRHGEALIACSDRIVSRSCDRERGGDVGAMIEPASFGDDRFLPAAALADHLYLGW